MIFFEKISQKEDFFDLNIDELQVENDSSSVKWVELTGGDVIYNYIHMMNTGHIIYLMIFIEQDLIYLMRQECF
jgi:hypothetical protein